MIGRIYRIQAYITWALVGGMLLLIEFGDIAWLRELARQGVLQHLTACVWLRTVLPIGTVLAIFARRRGMTVRSLVCHQLVTLLINLTMIYTMICVLVIASGGV
ncbi:MAG: hypothetical protein IJE07_08495 [Clostridia bacterium]|nr:hypothetical protein [Clostridia bacterium]